MAAGKRSATENLPELQRESQSNHDDGKPLNGLKYEPTNSAFKVLREIKKLKIARKRK